MRHPLQIFGILGIILLLGCEKVITIDLPDHEPVLIVNSFFAPDSVWLVHVTASQAINDPIGFKLIDDATVIILENGVPIDTLVHDVEDLYVSAQGRKPVADHAYTVRAKAPGYAEVQGSDIAPRWVVPANVTIRDSVSIDANGQPQSELSFTIRDWPGQQNYYILDVYQIYSYVLWDTVPVRQYSPLGVDAQDPILDTKTSWGQVLFDDATFDGQLRTIKLTFPAYERDTTYLKLSVVTEPCYRYVQSVGKYSNAQFDLFAEPVRVYSNMTPGMGIFAGRAGYEVILP